MTLPSSTPRYSLREEIANGITHGVGAVLAVVALAVLVGFSAVRGDAWLVAACSMFGGTMILAYTASTLYHAIPLARAKAVLRVLDHAAIFLLIAGTYTPFMLGSLRGPLGWTLLGAVWTVAAVGIALRLWLKECRHGFMLALYLAMGWAAVLAIEPMAARLGTGGLVLLAAGGAAYSIGVPFYLWDKLPFNHAIWHGFVLLGSGLHFFAVLLYVVP